MLYYYTLTGAVAMNNEEKQELKAFLLKSFRESVESSKRSHALVTLNGLHDTAVSSAHALLDLKDDLTKSEQAELQEGLQYIFKTCNENESGARRDLLAQNGIAARAAHALIKLDNRYGVS